MCRSVVLVQLCLQGRDRQAEDVSQLEHQLSEATQDSKQSLAANNDLSAKIAKEAAERELAQKEAAEARRQLEAEKLRAAAEITELKMLAEREVRSSHPQPLSWPPFKPPKIKPRPSLMRIMRRPRSC